jgi:hypothetical protein
MIQSTWNNTRFFDYVLESDDLLEFGASAPPIYGNTNTSSGNLTLSELLLASTTSDLTNEDDSASSSSIMNIIKHQYILLGWISFFVSIVGIVGNVFVIKILLQPSMRANSTNIFLTGLAVADLLALIIMFFLIPLRYLLVSHGSLLYYELHTFMFPYLYPLCTTFQFCSIYLTVSACINRNIIVYSAGEGHTSNDPRAALRAVLGVFFASFIVCLPFWFEYHTVIVQDGLATRVYLNQTALATDWHYRFLVHVCLMTIVTYTIPLAILAIMNYFLVLALVRTRRRKLDLGLRERNEVYITFMLVTIVLLFFVCQFPNLVVHLIHAFSEFSSSRSVAFSYWHQWANFLLIFNTASNFAIYCFFGENFRNAVRDTWTQVNCIGRKLDQENIEIQPVVKERIRKLSQSFGRISRLDRLSQSFKSSKSYQTLNNIQ